MKQGFIVALLCAGLAFAAASDKIGELQSVPSSEISKLKTLQTLKSGEPKRVSASEFEKVKKTLQTLKKVTDSKEKAIVSDIVVDPENDEIYSISLEGGSILMLLVTKKEQTSFLGDVIVRPPTFELGKTVCAYNGMFYDDTIDGSQLSRSELNSAGGWFYFAKYPASTMVIIERSSFTNNPAFRFTINRSGILNIARVITTGASTDEIYTTKPIPLNEWVYIQGRQNGLDHSLGWKTANDGESLTKRFVKNADATVDTFKGSFFDVAFVSMPLNGKTGIVPCPLYPENTSVKCRTSCAVDSTYTQPINAGFYVKEFFWNGSTPMFALMDNYDALEKQLFQPTNMFGLDNALINALIEAYIKGQINDAVFIYRDFGARKANIDLYTDDEDNPSVLGFDLRRLPPTIQ